MSRWSRAVLRAALLGVAVYYAAWGGEYSAFDLRRLAALDAAEQQGLDAARLRVDSLRAHADRLDDDPATIERLARERFGMIREGELLYRFIEVAPQAAAPARVAAAP